MKNDLMELRRAIGALGFHLPNGEWGAIAILFSTLIGFLIVNSILFVVFNWDDVDKRVNGLKGLVLYVMCLIYFLAYLLDWDVSILLTDTIYDGLYTFPYRVTDERLNTKKVIADGMKRLNTFWYYANFGYITIAISMMLIVFALQVQKNGIQDVTIETLYLAYPFYFPENYETLPMYFLAFTLQTAFFLHAATNAYCFLVSAFASMKLIEGELKLLQISLQDMENIIREHCENSQTRNSPNISLNMFFKHIVNHHHDIYRKAENVTKGIKLIAMSINSGMSILLCTGIYILVQRDDIMLEMQEVLYCSFLIISLYCYNLMGQKISTEDENLRNAFYQCLWINKPRWFRQSLLIVLARMNKPIEIKSDGLFALNFRNFSVTVRAAYSYYNLLNNFKS